MKKVFFLGIVLAVLAGVSVAGAETVKVVGASTIMPIIKDATESFQAKTGVTIELLGGGSGAGVTAIDAGMADVAMVSRALNETDPKDAVAVTIGLDGVAMIVNVENPLVAITSAQVVDLYTVKVTQWNLMGGAEGDVFLVHKAKGRSTREIFENFFKLKGLVSLTASEIGSNSEAITLVASDPLAIGYVSVGTAEKAIADGVAIKMLRLDGVDASVANVANETYPMRRPLNLATKGEPSLPARQLIDYMLSSEGQVFVKGQDFIAVK